MRTGLVRYDDGLYSRIYPGPVDTSDEATPLVRSARRLGVSAAQLHDVEAYIEEFLERMEALFPVEELEIGSVKSLVRLSIRLKKHPASGRRSGGSESEFGPPRPE